MIGSALGISPNEVNNEWLMKNRFRIGIVGTNNGKANDLWQIRKYEDKHIRYYQNNKAETPYKTAVIVRELLFESIFTLYFNFNNNEDLETVKDGLKNPSWAISLGRADELVRIESVEIIELLEESNLYYKNTVLPFDITDTEYEINLSSSNIGNLMNKAPTIMKQPITFIVDKKSNVREPKDFQTFSYIYDLPIRTSKKGFFDKDLNYSFQIF